MVFTVETTETKMETNAFPRRKGACPLKNSSLAGNERLFHLSGRKSVFRFLFSPWISNIPGRPKLRKISHEDQRCEFLSHATGADTETAKGPKAFGQDEQDVFDPTLERLYIGVSCKLGRTLCSGNCPPIKRENFSEISRKPFKMVPSCKMQGTVKNEGSVLIFSKVLSL
jgi:hypothetical protein